MRNLCFLLGTAGLLAGRSAPKMAVYPDSRYKPIAGISLAPYKSPQEREGQDPGVTVGMDQIQLGRNPCRTRSIISPRFPEAVSRLPIS